MRLIDADELVDELLKCVCINERTKQMVQNVINMIKRQPTVYDAEKAKTPTPTHPIPLDTQIYIQELESRYEMILKRMEEYEYSHLIEHDSEQMKHCEGADDCEYSDCSLCVWAKAKSIVRNIGKV